MVRPQAKRTKGERDNSRVERREAEGSHPRGWSRRHSNDSNGSENGEPGHKGPDGFNGPERFQPPAQDDPRARFYEHYRKEAEEYDKEFVGKHDEDLNTTLIFAGLFSAVTTAFITQVQPQLQPDPNQETAAYLRFLIYKIDNTTFDKVPTLPQWTGPPRTIAHVQSILYASLAASLLSAFLAMLGKQWLNRYTSIQMRGSAIQRSQNRQRKLDGVVAWYFDHVMESIPSVLQVALLLLGCALSKYLWNIDTTVAAVVLGVTSFGILFDVFVIVAGMTSDVGLRRNKIDHVSLRFRSRR